MYQVNDCVVYGSTGVCRITGIVMERFSGKEAREYYLLSPVYGNSVDIYIPTDSRQATMRRLMSREEIDELIGSMPQIGCEWVADDRFRQTSFKEILQSGDQRRIVVLIKTLHDRQVSLENDGRSLSGTDTEIMKTAEKLFSNEFALVLGIQPEQVVPFITRQAELLA